MSFWPFKFSENAVNKEELSSQILAMSEVISKLKKECESHQNRADRYWAQIQVLKKELAGDKSANFELVTNLPTSLRPIPYLIDQDDEYCRVIAKQEDGLTISYNREFDTSKGNYNWVNEGEALITLKYDNVGRYMGCPTTVKSPVSGIFERINNKLIKSGEEICRIKNIPLEKKEETIESLEREAIKLAVLQKERKKMIERETLDELIAEGKIFNVITLKDGNRMAIPSDVANAVWNRDGGCCCICGSRSELEFDHIIPVSKGGATTFRNLQLLCKYCNIRKSSRI